MVYLCGAQVIKVVNNMEMKLTLKIFPLSIIVKYTKLIGKSCYPERYGSHLTLEAAKGHCTTDPDCRGIYDNRCDSKGKYYLCPADKPYTSSDHDQNQLSCVHEKMCHSGYERLAGYGVGWSKTLQIEEKVGWSYFHPKSSGP